MRTKILIVDDDIDLLDLLTERFEKAGFSVVTAANGIEGLKQARSHSPDLIVLDLVLPELDGFSVCETLRRERPTANTPILMFTGLTSQLNRYAGMDCGATAYITKPVTPDELLTKVMIWLPDSQRPAGSDASTAAVTQRASADGLAASPGEESAPKPAAALAQPAS